MAQEFENGLLVERLESLPDNLDDADDVIWEQVRSGKAVFLSQLGMVLRPGDQNDVRQRMRVFMALDRRGKK